MSSSFCNQTVQWHSQMLSRKAITDLGYDLKKEAYLQWALFKTLRRVSNARAKTDLDGKKHNSELTKPQNSLSSEFLHLILLERSNFVGEFKIRVWHLHVFCWTLSFCDHAQINSTDLFPRDFPRESMHGPWVQKSSWFKTREKSWIDVITNAKKQDEKIELELCVSPKAPVC